MTSGFRRYTNLSSTIHILKSKSITLLNPATWDDKNDAYFMSEYKRLKKAKSVLALCFAEQNETYHHWRVFSPGSDGVCIEFNKDKLMSTIAQTENVVSGKMNYKLIKDIKTSEDIDVDGLPFIKRWPFRDEREFRLVFTSMNEKIEFKDYKINIESIKRITLSPWTPKTLAVSIKSVLKEINGCSKLKIYKSSLIDNAEWKHITSVFD